MNIRNLQQTPIIQSDQTDRLPESSSEVTAQNGISGTSDALERFSGNSIFAPQTSDEVIVQFENGDMRAPVDVGNLWDGTDQPPSSASPYAKDAAKEIAAFLFTGSETGLPAVQNSAHFATTSPGSDPMGDIMAFMLEYQKMMNKESREDKQMASAGAGLSEASMEFLIGAAAKLLKGDSAKDTAALSDALNQLKESKQEFARKLAEGSAQPVSSEQISHFNNWVSMHKWPPD